MGRELGVIEEQLRDLPRYRESPAFSKEESLAIDLAVEMAKVPVEPPPEFLNELRRCFDEAQLVELAAAIAWPASTVYSGCGRSASARVPSARCLSADKWGDGLDLPSIHQRRGMAIFQKGSSALTNEGPAL